MQLRVSRFGRALSALLLGVASWAGLSSSADAATLRPRLTHQDATVVVGPNGNGRWQVGLDVGTRRSATLRITLYPALRTRSAVESIIAGQTPDAAPLDTTGGFPLTCAVDGHALFDVAVGQWRDAYTSCGSVHPVVRPQCTARCNGVYPVRYTVNAGDGQITLWSLLTITNGGIARPVHLVWIVKSGATTFPTWRTNTPALRALAAVSGPVTVGLSANELNVSLFSSSPAAADYRAALAQFFANSNHRAMAVGPHDMDYGSLRAHGLGVDVPKHFDVVDVLASEINPNTKTTSAVFLPSPVSASSVAAIDHQGRHVVVVGEESLRSGVSHSLSWGSPFHISGVPRSARALVVDSPLSSLATRGDIEPARLAALTMGTLAMLYYQAPNAADPRTEVITTNLNQASPVFTRELATDIQRAPFISLRAVDAAASALLVGANHSPSERSLASAPTAPWKSAQISALANLNADSASLISTFSDPAPYVHLELARLNAEVGFTDHGSGVAKAQAALRNELSKYRVDQSTVIMATNAGTIPVTLYSSANYGVTGLLHLSAERMNFPDGDVVPVGLLTQTGSTRVRAVLTTGTSTLLRVTLTTTDGRVTLASGTVQVRYATASVVGYVLSGGSLLVIAWWWWRTTRRKRPVKPTR